MTTRVLGTPAAPGIAVGPVWRPGVEGSAREPAPAGVAGVEAAGVRAAAVVGREATQPEARIRTAAAAAAAQLQALAARLCKLDRIGEAEILEAQALMVVDPALVDAAVRLVATGLDPVAAVVASAEASARTLAALDDELLAARAADVRDVGARVARILAGTSVTLPETPSIAVAVDLPPSLVAEIPPGFLIGVALSGGSPTAHVAILARSLGIPAVVAAPGLLEAVSLSGPSATVGAPIAIDGETGEILLGPGSAELRELADLRAARAARDLRAAALRTRGRCARARGRGGRRRPLPDRVPVPAPPGGPDRSRADGRISAGDGGLRARSTGRDPAGRYRRRQGDSVLPDEPNPFLGVRAIRLAHGSRELLLTQLRAIWRAAGLAGVTPCVMAAMVSTIADARLLLELRDEARAAVVAAGGGCPDRMVTGLMIEVPSAAILAPELARIADFFSIGTNDLTQYVLAADRGNPSLARLQDALHPAVLRTIATVLAGADAGGIPVAVCGELAGDPAGALVLVGLGVDELSADAGSLDGIRVALAGVTGAELRELAARALAATDAETVRGLVARLLGRG